MILIDYEYGYWNPITYDLGNYLNEYSCDNAYPCGTGVTYYYENEASDEDIELIVKEYFRAQWTDEGKTGDEIEALWTQNKTSLVAQTKKCMILNSFYWGVWSIMMLQEEEETDASVFNWEFLRGRVITVKKQIDAFKF